MRAVSAPRAIPGKRGGGTGRQGGAQSAGKSIGTVSLSCVFYRMRQFAFLTLKQIVLFALPAAGPRTTGTSDKFLRSFPTGEEE
jgi:hypothetical protein